MYFVWFTRRRRTRCHIRPRHLTDKGRIVPKSWRRLRRAEELLRRLEPICHQWVVLTVLARIEFAAHHEHSSFRQQLSTTLIGLREDDDIRGSSWAFHRDKSHHIAFFGGDASYPLHHTHNRELLSGQFGTHAIERGISETLFQQLAFLLRQWMFGEVDAEQLFLPFQNLARGDRGIMRWNLDCVRQPRNITEKRELPHITRFVGVTAAIQEGIQYCQ
ncbi:MAG: hypothetical protein BWY63_03664 [Chloroflexi bacterium ADurb.Bin360]|nr:MAG: hypothetical protein BWY63_03664 [Chloroflexi bacterium ADurb.Bin360]